MQVQKLVYYGHGWHLALTDKPLINEPVEAWPYGPVIRTLFHEFKRWGNGSIQKPAAGALPFRTSKLEDGDPSGEALDTARAVLNRVWDVYGNYSGLALSALTHEPGSPWFEVRRKNPGARDVVIPNDTIRYYFKQRIDQDAAAANRV